MTFVERRARQLAIPWEEDTPDAKGFFVYAKEHYLKCGNLAAMLMYQFNQPPELKRTFFQACFDKLTTPLVYLWEAWSVMAPENKAKYSPELAKIHEESKKQAEDVFKRE